MESMRKRKAGWIGIAAALVCCLASVTAFAASPLNHNSLNTASTKWSGNGGWGVPGGKFGEFTCATCHNKTTTNIKRVVTTIPNFIGYSAFPAVTKSVVFRNLSSQGFGDDGVTRTTSNLICSVCHTQTAAHKSNNPTTSNHKNANRADCTNCHSHEQAFAASCKSCHGYPPTTNTIGGANGLASPATGATGGLAGQHGIHNNLMGCDTCHNAQDPAHTLPAFKKLELGFAVNNTNISTWGATAANTGTANVYPNASLSNGYTWEVPSTSAGTTLTQVGNNNTCSLYCHGGGWAGDANTASAQSNALKATPNWNDVAAMSCDDCHGGSAGRVPRPGVTGAHTRHAGNAAGGLSISCSSCHGATAAGGAHVDGKVTVNVSGLTGGAGGAMYNSLATPYNSGNVVANQTYKNCSNIYCHSSIQGAGGTAAPTYYAVVWGAGNTGCTMCHVADATLATGSHAKHVTASTSHAAYLCADCHNSTSGNALHANGTIDVSMTTYPGTYNQSGAPQNGYSNCTVTCHGAALTPNWGGTLAAGCAGCHGNKTSGLTAPHAAHMNFPATGGAFSCTDCHANVVSNDTTVSTTGKNVHINAYVNFSGAYAPKQQALAGSVTCFTSSCHNSGKTPATAPRVAVTWTGTIDCSGCHGSAGNVTGMPYPDAVSVNAHAKHMNNTVAAGDAARCVQCHDTTVNGTNAIITGSAHLNKTRDVRFTKVNSFAAYSGNYSAAGRTCSTTYCHGGTNGNTPLWGSGTLACSACHAATGASLGGAHTIHNNVATTSYTTAPGASSTSATAYNFNCSACHGVDTAQHIDYPKNAASDATIFFGFSSAGRGTVATNNYNTNRPTTGGVSDTQGFKWTNGAAASCTTTYCHSNGRGSNGISSTVNWGTAARDASCNTCHGNKTNSAVLSGAHASHVNNAAVGVSYGCVDCHATTVSSDVAIATNSYNKHVNKFVDYSGVYAGRNKTCANIYCHSNGRGTFQATATYTWSGGANLTCASCHGNPPTGGVNDAGHGGHAAAGAVNCYLCHANSVTTTGAVIAGTGHINKAFDLAGSGATIKWGTANVTFGVTTAGTPAVPTTCNTIVCHNAGTVPAKNATWGTPLDCSGCHDFTQLTGAHQTHMGALTPAMVTLINYTANKSPNSSDTTFKYGFGCVNCHPANLHFNGSIDVVLDPSVANIPVLRTKNIAGASYNFGAKTCANTYCHSGGGAVTSANTTITWTTTFAAVGGDRCAKCHLNSPTTNAHVAHTVGIHNDDVFNGKSGKLATSGATTVNAAHGAGNRSTTIDCYICHFSTVNVAGNDKNIYCATCHVAGNTVGAAVTRPGKITSLMGHVNGATEVSFFNQQIATKAQLRDGSFDSYTSLAEGQWRRNRAYKTYGSALTNYTSAYDRTLQPLNALAGWNGGAKTCATVACHGGASPVWNTTPLTCDGCHTRL